MLIIYQNIDKFDEILKASGSTIKQALTNVSCLMHKSCFDGQHITELLH